MREGISKIRVVPVGWRAVGTCQPEGGTYYLRGDISKVIAGGRHLSAAGRHLSCEGWYIKDKGGKGDIISSEGGI